MGFSPIFGDFPPSINSCGHKGKIFPLINKNHFRSLKKAKSSFEVRFLISFPKPEIFIKNGKVFLSIFDDFHIFFSFFPLSIKNCGDETKNFSQINKDHFRSLKKAESSFEVGFWISLLKPEIFQKNEIFIFHQQLVFFVDLVIFVFKACPTSN